MASRHDRNSELSRKLQRVTDAAARTGAVIYSIDAGTFTGKHQTKDMRLDSLGRADKFSSGETAAFQAALGSLAENTGGRALLESETLPSAINEALKESVNYYLVAWSSDKGEQKVESSRTLTLA